MHLRRWLLDVIKQLSEDCCPCATANGACLGRNRAASSVYSAHASKISLTVDTRPT